MNIRDKYINTFFNTISDDEKEKIYFDQYMWHAFSYKRIKCYEGKNAIEQLNKKENNNVYVIFQNEDETLEVENINYDIIFNNIKDEKWKSDCYIMDKDFKWTFVFTHETCCSDNKAEFYIGPFFYER